MADKWVRLVTAQTPTNIAVIKYWGKRDETLILPVNDSISVTLDPSHLCTTTTVSVSPSFNKDRMWLNGKEISLSSSRFQSCLREIRSLADDVEDEEKGIKIGKKDWQKLHVHIASYNNFPTAAGPLKFLPRLRLSIRQNSRKEMVASQIWDAMEVAGEAAKVSSSEILSSHLVVDTSLPPPDMKPRIIELCKNLFKKWSGLEDSKFSVETVSGGITNLLLKVTVREEEEHDVSVTVRLYGPNTDIVINRERELQAIRYLSAAGFGAKLLATFGNGMVQSFINARTLTPEDMRNPRLAAEIAKQLRKFHQVEIPGSKEPQLWSDVDKFFEKASNLSFDDADKQIKYQSISFEEIHGEINELKELTDKLNAPVVFAHNDLLSGNLMLNEEHEKLYLIDFEYGSYNYRGFDIGNHFNEYAGYDCDYSLYPSKADQYHFFRNYLHPDSPNEVADDDLKALYVETNTYMLTSHLYWALWALIQAKMSPIDFNYLGYFFSRYEEYKKRKGSALSVAVTHLSGS